MLVLKLFHGTPMYSQAPQLQQDLFSSHRFNILASIGLFATTLPPQQLESGYITLLLKTLQGLLILTLRYYMILWCLWPHLLLSPLLLSSGHPDPFAIPGTCQVCFCCRTWALSICSTWYSSPRCHRGCFLFSFIAGLRHCLLSERCPDHTIPVQSFTLLQLLALFISLVGSMVYFSIAFALCFLSVSPSYNLCSTRTEICFVLCSVRSILRLRAWDLHSNVASAWLFDFGQIL